MRPELTSAERLEAEHCQRLLLHGTAGDVEVRIYIVHPVPAQDPCATCTQRPMCDPTAWLRGERPRNIWCQPSQAWEEARARYKYAAETGCTEEP